MLLIHYCILQALLIFPAETSQETVKRDDGIVVLRIQNTPAAPCFTLYTPTPGKIGLRNNCNTCKVAIMSWQGVGVRKYRVSPNDQFETATESFRGELIGQEDCK